MIAISDGKRGLRRRQSSALVGPRVLKFSRASRHNQMETLASPIWGRKKPIGGIGCRHDVRAMVETSNKELSRRRQPLNATIQRFVALGKAEPRQRRRMWFGVEGGIGDHRYARFFDRTEREVLV